MINSENFWSVVVLFFFGVMMVFGGILVGQSMRITTELEMLNAQQKAWQAWEMSQPDVNAPEDNSTVAPNS